MRAIIHVIWLMVFVHAHAAHAASEVVLAINEGLTYQIASNNAAQGQATVNALGNAQTIRAKYRDLALLIGQAIEAPVRIEVVNDYSRLDEGMRSGRYALAYVHPTHHAARAVRDYRYQVIAFTKGYTDYKASFLTRADTGINTLDDLRNQSIATTDPDSVTAWLTRATLRDAGINIESINLFTTRYQDALPFLLASGLRDVIATGADDIVADWIKKGGKLIHQSKPVPVKIFLAAPKWTAPEIARLKLLLLDLDDSASGREVLNQIGYEGFAPGLAERLLEIALWWRL